MRARKAMKLSEHLVDLVQNAVDALAKHVLIMLSEEEGGKLVLTVQDDGVGIDPQEVEKALRGEKAPRGRGIFLLKKDAEEKGGSFEYFRGEKGSTVTASWDKTEIGSIGSALLVFWQEFPIMDFTLSMTSSKGVFVLDSRLVGEKYGDPNDVQTMVKVRKDINLTQTNLYGGI